MLIFITEDCYCKSSQIQVLVKEKIDLTLSQQRALLI